MSHEAQVFTPDQSTLAPEYDNQQCLEMEVQQKKLALFNKQVNDVLGEMQAYLQTTIPDEMTALLVPIRCPLQTVQKTDAHHAPALATMHATLTRRLTALASHIEMQMGLSNLSAPSTLHIESETDSEDGSEDEDEDTRTKAPAAKSATAVAVVLPSLKVLKQLARKRPVDASFLVRVDLIVKSLESNMRRYSKSWKKRDAMHHVINNTFLTGMKNICAFTLDSFTKTLCPHLTELVNQQKQQELTNFHEVYLKQYMSMKDERKTFYNAVGSWADSQAHACIKMLEILLDLIGQCSQRRALMMTDEEEHGRQPALKQLTMPSPIYPLSYSPLSVLYIHSQDFHGLRPNHSMNNKELIAQHQFLLEAMSHWRHAMKNILAADMSMCILPDMFRRLNTWVNLYQALFHDVILSLAHGTGQAASALSQGGNEHEYLPEETDTSHFPKPSVLLARGRAPIVPASKQSSSIRLFAQDAAVAEMNESEQRKQLELEEGNATTTNTQTTNNTDNQTNQSFRSEDESGLQQVRQYLDARREEEKARFEKVDHQFETTQALYDTVRAQLQELNERRATLDLAGQKTILQKQEEHDESEDEDGADASNVEEDETDDSVLREMHSLQQHLQRLEVDRDQLRTKYEQLEPLRLRLQDKVRVMDDIVSFVHSFEGQIKPKWIEFSREEAKYVSQWTKRRDDYHFGYTQLRSRLWALINSQVYEIVSNVRMQICNLFRQLEQDHMKELRSLRDLFESNSILITQADDMIRVWHKEITIGMPNVSKELMAFNARLESVVIQKDKLAAMDYANMLRQVVHMFWSCLQDATQRLVKDPALTQYLARMDKCCCEEHQVGIAHPYREPMSKLPCIVLKGTTLDKAMYQMHCSSAHAQEDIRPAIVKQRMRATNDWSKLDQSFEQAEHNAYRHSVALDPTLYLSQSAQKTLDLPPAPNVTFNV